MKRTHETHARPARKRGSREAAPREPEHWNRPFSGLREALRQAGSSAGRQAIDSDTPAPAPVAEDPEPATPVAEEAEEELFARAMEGVSRSRWPHAPVGSEPAGIRIPVAEGRDEARMMQEAVRVGSAEISNHPEYIEAWVDLRGRRYLPALREGSYSIQDCLDLHGFSRAEARIAVEEFVLGVPRPAACCVKIVHGRGINSAGDRAVLKESLQRWLTTRRMARRVVAYSSAPVSDGGVGAVYVLLRRG